MKVLFMVRKPYFDAIVAGTKTEEIRRYTSRWWTVSQHVGERGAIAVFMCGRDIHRRIILGTRSCISAEIYLGRALSKDGKKDVGNGPVIVFLLGDVA